MIAAVLDLAGTKDTRRFSTCIEDLLNLRQWILDSKCQRVAIESTGIYWIPTYTLLENKVETIIANPFQIKNIPGVLSDIFGKSGMIILNGILNGKKLRFFYERIKAKKGHKKAIVALARKLATIVHHLLTFKEMYSKEEGKQKKVKLPKFVPVQDFSIDDMIGILCEAGYSVNKTAVKTY